MTDPLRKLPTEIRLMIFKKALYNPAADVVLGNDEFEQVRPRQIFPELLQTCHQYYHEGRNFLFLNKLTFCREGMELPQVIKPLGVLSCCTSNCHGYGEKPKLGSVRFLLGDNTSGIEGDFYTKSFRAYLLSITGQIKISNLTIEVKMYCWAARNKPFMFCNALKKVDLTETLVLTGIGCYDRVFTTDPGDMKGTLCAGKPQIRVVELNMSLVSYLNVFAWHPVIIASENVEDVPFTIRENMTTTFVNAAGHNLWVDNNIFVRYYDAYYNNGQLIGRADLLNYPPLTMMTIASWNVPFIAAGFQNQQVAATGNNAGGQVLQNVVYRP